MREKGDKDWGLTLEGHLLMWGWAELGGGIVLPMKVAEHSEAERERGGIT